MSLKHKDGKAMHEAEACREPQEGIDRDGTYDMAEFEQVRT